MKRIVIIGGGASGLMCAIHAKRDDNEVIILENREDLGKKILVTGNGRCNYFNENQDLKYYYSKDKELLKNIITIDNTNLVKDFFSNNGIVPLIKDGYYYPYSNQAVTIKDLLMRIVLKKGIKLVTNILVEEVTREEEYFIINPKRENMKADIVVLATGSNAYYGDDIANFGYDIASSFKHTIIKPLPALVKLVLEETYLKSWSGVRANVSLKLLKDKEIIKRESGEMQFTDYGISGICVFNVSGLVSKMLERREKVFISINFVPWYSGNFKEYLEDKEDNLKEEKLSFFLEGFLNKKLIEVILKKNNLTNKRWIDLNDEEKDKLVEELTNLTVEVKSTKDLKESQVASGGVKISEVNLGTMESLKQDNLYIIGELLDIYGECGGYNLTFAWLSGILAGRNISKK